MGDRDAFGRERGEDELAAMGWAAPTGSEEAAAQPAGEAETAGEAGLESSGQWTGPATVATPAGATGAKARGGCALVGVLVIAVVGIALAVLLAGSGGDGDEGTSSSGGLTTAVPATPEAPEAPAAPKPEVAATPEKPSAPAAPPRGLARRSLVRSVNLAPALRRLRRVAGGRVRYVRVAPDRVLVQVVRNGGRLRTADIAYDGHARVVSTTSGGFPAAGAMAWSQINTHAPERIARSAARQTGRRTAAFDYAVLLDAAGLRWAAFLRGGKGFLAQPDGRGVRPQGG